MNDAISVELQFFLISILCGAIMLFIYDILRIFRRVIKHDGFFIALEDLFFWVGASLFIFTMMYKENDGIIRGFAVIGMAIGMILYHNTLSDVFVSLITKLVQLLMSPFAFAIKKIRQFFNYLWSKGKKTMNFILRRLKKWTKSVRITLNKRKLALSDKRKNHKDKKRLKKHKKSKQI